MMQLVFSPLTVAVMVGLSVLALALAFRPARASEVVEGRLSAFLNAVEARQAADSLGELEGSFIERVIFPMIRAILHAVGRLAPSKNLESINDQLTMAGRPGNLTAVDFLGIRILSLIICVVLGIVLGRVLGGRDPKMGLLAVGFCLLLGYMLPNTWIQSTMRKRRDAIQTSLPDALDMLTICVEAGLAFESALQRVVDQWGGPLSEELARVVAEIRLGIPRLQAMRRLAQRCNTPDVSSFVAVLVQADSMGTSIAQVLHSQSDQIRVLRRQRAEEKANKAPIKVLLVMVAFIFPAIFVVILGPAIPRIMEAFGG